jgi:hypothetical protein
MDFSYCNNLKAKAINEYNLDHYQFKFFDSISEVFNQWDLTCSKDQYWQSNYHNALEQSLPKGLKPYYCLVYKNDYLIGTIYFQHKKINLAEAIKLKKEDLSSKVIKKVLLSNLNMDTLVVGNLLLTGKYGFHFIDQLPIDEQFNIVIDGVNELCRFLKTRKISIGPILMKDFFEDQVYSEEKFEKFSKFVVQPNMIMTLEDHWKNIQDYSIDLKAKARTRFNRARNKFDQISSRFLTLDDLIERKDEMFILYNNIVDNVDFNLFFLDKDYFIKLKFFLKDNFNVKGYFDQSGKMVGFYSMLKNYDHLDAHFLGYDPICNKECQLYLNILYDMIAFGVSNDVSKINMSRTAMEIKSSVGARPSKMFCYLKHRSDFYNQFVKRIVDYLYKEVEWEERNPFK